MFYFVASSKEVNRAKNNAKKDTKPHAYTVRKNKRRYGNK
tara:strand:- start:261 stop:380 length:120 start_codon:yes stop_codon:yes gene_type:complete